MALDGILIRKLVPAFSQSCPLRIQKIYQISQTEILFQCHSHEGRLHFIVSTHSIYNRFNITKRNYPTPEEPGNFVMVLRKHLEGSTIIRIEQGGLDRYVVMSIATRNELGDRILMELYIELAGKYANVILVRDGHIVDALKRIPPFENNQRTIQPGARFTIIPPQTDKRDPFTATSFDPDISLARQFHGVSPLLADEIIFRLKDQSFTEIMKEIDASDRLFVSNKNGEAVFHCIELKHLGYNQSYPIHEGFDVVYYHKEEKDRIKQISGDVFKLVKREKKHYMQKLPKLQEAYEEALDCDRWREYGDLLYAYNIRDTKGETIITLTSFETEQPVNIPLDPKLNGPQNAQRCYTKYTKGKKGQSHLIEQINICQSEIDYFEAIEQQLEYANFNDAKEIQEELIRLGYMKARTQKIRKNNKKKKGPEAPNYTSLTLANGITIHFGKNNIQNEYVTFRLARKSDTWFHAKDYHGAHVIAETDHPDEYTIRACAQIAAWFSKGRQSSSVPINYCSVKELKKIPGAKHGMVQLGSYRTIYIDPDEQFIMDLKVKE